MANQLEMAKVFSILTLHEQGCSNRQIAQLLGVHRETVRRHLELARQACSDCTGNPPPGSGDPSASALSGPASSCEPFRQVILDKLEQGLSGKRIWQDLVAESGLTGGYDCIKRFVRKRYVPGAAR